MLSKLARSTYKSYYIRAGVLLTRKGVNPRIISVRHQEMLPPSQYDVPWPKKLKLGYALKTYWEIIPLFVTTCFALFCMFFSIIWAFKNKVDVVFTSRSRENISRTMDLRNPTVHKMVIINQRYEPWPEMADVLDKMKMAEKRALMRAQSCNNP